MRPFKESLIVACALLLAPGMTVDAQQSEQKTVSVEGYRNSPARREFNESLLSNLRLPAGFRVNVFHQKLDNPRMMTVASDGTVYVTNRDKGEVVALADRNGDGRADGALVVASNLKGIHGLTIRENRLYLVTVKELYVADMRSDGTLAAPRLLVRDLPDGGQHPNRTIAFGSDGMLYLSVGSTCNACDEPNMEHATMLRLRPDGTERSVYARGLRNTVGWGWHPQTGELWGMDHGSDWRGNDIPPEELNSIKQNGHYGWPFCYGQRIADDYLQAEPKPKGTTKEQFCPQTVAPALTYQAHSAPIQMVFYNASQFPSEYRGDAFIAMRGSWNRNPATGYKVVRVRFENGKPTKFEDFLTGFLIEGGRAHFARLAGVAIAQDGSLLVSDDTNGVIYRVSYGEK
jgi:glucose/arabinose dehydrogenase